MINYKINVLTLGIFISLTTLNSCSENNEPVVEEPIVVNNPDLKNGKYNNKLVYVLGDVKQGFINNKITTKKQVDNLLKGFKALGVNGIRIPIFAPNQTPNPQMYNYFYKKAKRKGFNLFANPALWQGGRRIANGTLHNTGESVLGKKAKKDALVKHIKNYSKQYKCKWICPFNEDGKPGDIWYKEQMNNIFSELNGNLNGANLIGPCTWGIPGGIDVLNKTTIKNSVSIVTTHNLGFNHDKWNQFKNLAGNKKVWDSETNFNKKYPNKKTRIEAAVDAGVNGIVLYDSWKYINMNDGSLKQTGKDIKNIYLK